MSWFLPTLWWYLATCIATIACVPVTLLLFRRLVGQGAGFARPVAMLVTIWPAWFLSGIVGDGAQLWTAATLWAGLALVAAAGWFHVLRRRWITRETLFHFGVAELVYLGVFAVGVSLRGFVAFVAYPGTTDTEKPGELMMLASVMHSTSIPPQDAWFSGHSLNYYYLGYAIWGGFGKMVGIMPAEVFNLALVSTFAMGFVAIAGLVAAVLGRFYGEWAARIGGVVAAVMTLIIGNAWSSWKVLTNDAGDFYWSGVGWRASRIIRDSSDSLYGYNPITEFPSFSFVLGDLHPHVMALPFAATSLGIAWALLTMGRVPEGETFWRRNALLLGLGGAVVGSLYALNSWDFPTYGGIAVLALTLGTIGIGVWNQLAAIAVFGVSAIVAWLPFHTAFTAPSRPANSAFADAMGNIPVVGGILQGISLYQMLPTSPGEFFSIFGFQYTVLLVVLVAEVIRRQQPRLSARRRRAGERIVNDPVPQYLALTFGVLCLIGAVVLPIPLLLFCGLPVIVVWLLLDRDARLIPSNISLVLFALALVLLLVPEYFYINDIYGARMNTVFKVSYQVWLLTSVASGIGIVALWKSVRHHAVLRLAVPMGVTVMLLIGCAYPMVASDQWLDWRNPSREWIGIDGLAHLKDDPAYAAEYAAIEWLLENAEPDDVLLAAGGGEWRPEIGRVAGASGVPSLMGWLGHERQWHLGDEATQAELPQRVAAIDALYGGPPSPELLDRYGVTLIYIGPTEARGIADLPADPGTLSTLPIPTANDTSYPGAGWELVFEQDGVRIYRRIVD